VDKLNVSVQAPAHLIAQAVDLLLEEQKRGILFFAGKDFPPLPGTLPKKKRSTVSRMLRRTTIQISIAQNLTENHLLINPLHFRYPREPVCL